MPRGHLCLLCKCYLQLIRGRECSDTLWCTRKFHTQRKVTLMAASNSNSAGRRQCRFRTAVWFRTCKNTHTLSHTLSLTHTILITCYNRVGILFLWVPKFCLQHGKQEVITEAEWHTGLFPALSCVFSHAASKQRQWEDNNYQNCPGWQTPPAALARTHRMMTSWAEYLRIEGPRCTGPALVIWREAASTDGQCCSQENHEKEQKAYRSGTGTKQCSAWTFT